MKARIAIWALLLLLAAPATAGVVEDAAEALQGVPSDRPADSRRFEEAASPLSPTGAGSWNTSTGSGGAGSSPARTGSARSGAGSVGAPASGGGVVNPHPTPEVGDEAPHRQRKARDRSDNLATMFSLLAILLLVAAAGFYSRRLGRDD